MSFLVSSQGESVECLKELVCGNDEAGYFLHSRGVGQPIASVCPKSSRVYCPNSFSALVDIGSDHDDLLEADALD